MQIYQLRLMFCFAENAQLLLGRNILTLLGSLSLERTNHSLVHFPHHISLKLVLLAEKW